MIVRILANTPPWVFGLFVLLLVFGLMQTRTRTVGRIPALLLPAGMVALSLAGVHSSFGFTPVPLAVWAIALTATAAVGYAFFRDERVRYDAPARRFFVPGSWMPLGVIMAIFFAKYVYAVLRALNADLIAAPLFIAGLSAVYGLLSGYFAAKGFNLVKRARIV